MRIIGLDVGGTKIEGIFWDGKKIISGQKIKTPRNKKGFLAALDRLIKGLMGVKGARGIGVAMAGAIDISRGRIIRSPNIQFMNGFALGDYLRKKFRKPIKVHNDTKAFLIAEEKFGFARGKKNVIALTLGTGVGGAALADGHILKGSHVTAVELGHIVIAENGDFLTLEELTSSHAFRKLKPSDPLYWQKEAERGNKRAEKIYETIGMYLGVGLANLVNIFDPELIILGGGIARASHLFLPAALRTMRKHTIKSIPNLPPVKVSKLKHAGALGAAVLFLE